LHPLADDGTPLDHDAIDRTGDLRVAEPELRDFLLGARAFQRGAGEGDVLAAESLLEQRGAFAGLGEAGVEHRDARLVLLELFERDRALGLELARVREHLAGHGELGFDPGDLGPRLGDLLGTAAVASRTFAAAASSAARRSPS